MNPARTDILMKTRYVALLYAWLLSGAFLFSQDCIIVVDATGSMKDPLGKEPRGIGKNKFDPRKPKHEHVQKALVKYLDNTPLAGQRVYIYFFNNGNDGEKEEGKEETEREKSSSLSLRLPPFFLVHRVRTSLFCFAAAAVHGIPFILKQA